MTRLLSILLAVLALAAGAGARAVSLSPDGVGQALIYPYYTVRSSPQSGAPYNVLFSVVNGANHGKAVKLRMREARTGATVFEAIVFLSIRDVWTAAIIPYGNGAAIVSTDHSCTIPALAPGLDGHPDMAGVFTSQAYASDPVGSASDRVQEGFVEILEMGEIRAGSPLEAATGLVMGHAPCTLPVAQQAFIADLDPPTGRLYGSATLIAVMEGTAYGYDAVALDGWSGSVQFAGISGGPVLGDANPPVSSIVDGQRLLTSTWASGIDAVGAVLSANTLEVEFMRDAAVAGATDVVYTLPTRPLQVDETRAMPPFHVRLGPQGACESVFDSTLDRDGRSYDPNGGTFFPEFVPFGALCWATNVQSFDAPSSQPSLVLGSPSTLVQLQPGGIYFPDLTPFASGIALLSSRSPSGPLSLDTVATDLKTGAQSHLGPASFAGLPMLGIAFVRYVNGTLVSDGRAVLANYGITSNARRTRFLALP